VRRLAIALVALAALGSLAHGLWLGVVTDDGGIALAYGRTLASGHGLRLTEWSQKVEAFSDPLWVLWLALGYALHIGGPQFARISGVICGALAVLLLGWVTPAAEGRTLRPRDALAPLLLACDTTYNFWLGSGLETGAFALSLTAAMLLLARRSRWSWLPAGLLAVLRPEGPLYALLLAPLAHKRLRWLLLAALPALAWLALRLAYCHQWLPNSYFAKRTWNYGPYGYLQDWFTDGPWHYALFVAPLALVTGRTRRAALIALGPAAAAVAFIVFSRGDWMGEHRFAAHALPAAALAAGLVPSALYDLTGDRNRDVGWVSGALLLALVASHVRKRDGQFPLWFVADQGRWFRDEARKLGMKRHARVAHFDIGGLALESGAEIIDLAGLADTYVGRVGYKDERAVKDYIFDKVKPDMLNVHGPVQYLAGDPRMKRDYDKVATGVWGENWVRWELMPAP